MTLVSQVELIARAKDGEVVSFSTDTVPALAVLPERSHLLFATKQRPATKPLILMAADSVDLWSYVAGTEVELKIWREVAQNYWPGALTLVLKATSRVPAAMNPMDPTTIGVRVPDRSIARSILSQTGPLATTSANLSGEAPLETAIAIEKAFPGVLILETSEWEKGSGLPSTVAKWTGEGWQILRQGSIKM